MARAPRRTSRQYVEEIEPGSDPLGEAMLIDQEGVAGDLSEILDKLKDFDQGSIKGILYMKPVNGMGAYKWIEETVPPFDLAAIFADLKERFGGGDFQLRILAGGRIRKNVDFSIVKEKGPVVAPPKENGNDMLSLFGMMMQSQTAASDGMMQMMMANQQSQTAMLTAILPALAGGKTTAADFLPLIAAMKPEPNNNNSMKDTVETLAALKGLLPNPTDGGGFDPDDIAGSLVKIAGPVAGALGKAFSGRNGAATDNPQPGANGHASAPLMLPAMRPNGPPVTTEHTTVQDYRASRYPLLDLVRDDVLYCFMRGHSPDRAAEMVYDTIDAHDVSDEAINEVFTAFTLAGDNWLTDLAAEGIDLRSRPEWATEFLAALVDIHVNAGEDDDAERRGSGGQADAVANGGTGGTG